MKIALQIWNRFWFAPVDSGPLGILRITLIGYLTLWELPSRILALSWANQAPIEFIAPGIGLRLNPLPFPFPEEQLHLLQLGLTVCGALSVLGVFTRLALALFAVGFIYLMGVESAWGWHDHGPSLVAFVLLILPVAPGIERYSLGSWIKSRAGAAGHGRPELVLGWGLKLILVTVAMIYFTSGLSKIRHGGFSWLNGKTLGFYLSGQSRSNHIQQFGGEAVSEEHKWRDGIGLEFYIYGAITPELGKQFAEMPMALAAFATAAVLLELAMPLILTGLQLRNLLFVSAALFHLSVYFLMGIKFFPWIIIDLALVDWRKIWALRRPSV